MKKAVLICLLSVCSFLFSASSMQACSCIPSAYDFCTSQQNLPSDVIILGKKIADFQYAMEVEVIEVLSGNESRTSLLIWGDPGWMCRPYASGFAVGDSFVFSINKHVSTPQPPENINDYWLSICGVYWLRYTNGWVYGNGWMEVTPNVDSLSLEDFRNQGCFMTGREDEILPVQDLSVYPNPVTQTDFTVKVPDLRADLVVTDIMGKVVYSLPALEHGGFLPTEVHISPIGWNTGIYFVRYREEVVKILID